jgi:hypothetical protein
MMRQRSSLVSASLAAAVLFLLVGARCALANSVTYTLNFPNATISANPSPYATVTVDLTSSKTATITFDALTTAGQGYLLVGDNIADVNVSATSWTIGDFTESHLTGFKGTVPTSAGSGSVNGFGRFNQTTDNEHGGFAYAASVVDFTLTDMSGIWASAASVLTPNRKGYVAAARIAVCNVTPCTKKGGALVTGFAAAGPKIVAVPEASAVTLTSLVLIAFGALLVPARRRQLT